MSCNVNHSVISLSLKILISILPVFFCIMYCRQTSFAHFTAQQTTDSPDLSSKHFNKTRLDLFSKCISIPRVSCNDVSRTSPPSIRNKAREHCIASFSLNPCVYWSSRRKRICYLLPGLTAHLSARDAPEMRGLLPLCWCKEIEPSSFCCVFLCTHWAMSVRV